MNRYDPEIFSAVHNAITKPDSIKPLQLTLTQFYDFMLQRYFNEAPEISSKTPITLDMLLATANTNPLSVYIDYNIAYLPEGSITWSINKYEGN